MGGNVTLRLEKFYFERETNPRGEDGSAWLELPLPCGHVQPLRVPFCKGATKDGPEGILWGWCGSTSEPTLTPSFDVEDTHYCKNHPRGIAFRAHFNVSRGMIVLHPDSRLEILP